MRNLLDYRKSLHDPKRLIVTTTVSRIHGSRQTFSTDLDDRPAMLKLFRNRSKRIFLKKGGYRWYIQEVGQGAERHKAQVSQSRLI